MSYSIYGLSITGDYVLLQSEDTDRVAVYVARQWAANCPGDTYRPAFIVEHNSELTPARVLRAFPLRAAYRIAKTGREFGPLAKAVK